jgi:hypothetical protein
MTTTDHTERDHLEPPEGSREHPTSESTEVACAWADFRKDYGVSAEGRTRKAEHRAFRAGWEAARGTLDVGGPQR